MTADVMKLVGEVEALLETATPPYLLLPVRVERMANSSNNHLFCVATGPLDLRKRLLAQYVPFDCAQLFAALVNAWPTLKSALETLAQQPDRYTRMSESACSEGDLLDQIEDANDRADKAQAEATALREALATLLKVRGARDVIDSFNRGEPRYGFDDVVSAGRFLDLAEIVAWDNARSLTQSTALSEAGGKDGRS